MIQRLFFAKRADARDEVLKLVESCLEKAPERRLQSSAKLVEELESIRALISVQPVPPGEQPR